VLLPYNWTNLFSGYSQLLTIPNYVLSTMGVSKESISKFLIGNRFHVKLRILSPYSNRIWGCVILLRMRKFTWNRFPIKKLLIDSLLTPIVESTHLNRDMCKFESSQKDERRWQSTDSSKAYRNTSAFKYTKLMIFSYHSCYLSHGTRLEKGFSTCMTYMSFSQWRHLGKHRSCWFWTLPLPEIRCDQV